MAFILASHALWQGFRAEHWGGQVINQHHPNGAPNMRKSTLLSASTALALVLAMAMPSASFAWRGGGGGGHVGGFGGGVHMGGGAGFARPVGGGAAFAARPVGGGAAFAARPVGGAGIAVARPGWNGGGTAWNGGGPRGWNGGAWHRRGWGSGAAVAAGVAAGAALGSYAYYGGPDYYDDTYYDAGPGYDSGVAVVPAEPIGGDASYCAQRYRSYDPASGTYLGYDGLRHPCP